MESSCENTVDAVSDMLYGIKIDGYIAMNIDAIKVINHLAGGVPVTIEDDFFSIGFFTEDGRDGYSYG